MSGVSHFASASATTVSEVIGISSKRTPPRCTEKTTCYFRIMRRFMVVFFSLAMCSMPSFSRAQSAAPALDDAAIARFVEQLTTHGNAGDCEALRRMFDVGSMIARGLEGIPLQPSERSSLTADIERQLMTPNTGLVSQMCAGAARFRIVPRGRASVDGRDVVRFRLQARHSGAVFADFVPGRDRSGNVVVVDINMAATSGWVSEEIRDTAVPIGAANPAFARTLDARGRLLRAHFPAVRQALEAASVGDVQRLETVIAALPELLRNDPSLLRVRVQGAQQSGNDAAMRRAVEDFLRLHPNDPCAASLTLDLRIIQGDFMGAIASVDRLEQLIGRDPFFDLTRALMLAESGRGADARTHLLRAVQADPDFVEAWTAVLDLSTALERHLDATRAYQALVRLSAVPPTFATDPAYAQLRASPELRQAMSNARH
jgi:hypothetical protein